MKTKVSSTYQNWFEVDKEGLKQLQAGKPKHYLVRELIQNAWDEDVKVVEINLSYKNGTALIEVIDDSKAGFKDIKDSFTLYKDTYKRKDPEKRGRFNLGEKQAFSICEKAQLITTKGTIIFDKEGRTEIPEEKLKQGSKINVWVKMTQEEYDEILETIKLYNIPEHIKMIVNGEKYKSKKPDKSFTASLTTEISDGNILRQTTRKTTIHLYKTEKTYLYEMGIPVCKIECDYSIDVQQKIPMGIDRETVSQAYLRDVFSEVLNHIFEELDEESSSQVWVREAMSDERINQEAVETVIEKRFGDKVCVADTFDPNSIDEAISNGYRVIRGTELGKQEWNILKKFNILKSSSSLFGSNFTQAKCVEPNTNQRLTGDYAKKIAKRLLNIDISVVFVKERDMVAAQFGNNELTFNIAKLGRKFFEEPVSDITTNLILHELGHYAGNHTEEGYHSLITKMAGELVILALEEPEFFEVK